MKRSSLTKEADELLAVGETLAAVLSENEDLYGISPEFEALLRASIAAAEYAIDAYVAVLDGSRKSPVAMSHLAEAKSRCDRKIRQLKRRVLRSVTELRRHMNRGELAQTAGMSIRM